MRLPLAIPLDARTGAATKDGRLTNAVVETYEGQTIVVPRPGLSRIASGAGVAGGVTSFDGQLFSVNGTTLSQIGGTVSAFAERTSADEQTWVSIAYGKGLFVAGSAEGGIMTSPDGITWTLRTASAANPWYGIAYGNGRFVAVSNSGTNRVMISDDGISWQSGASAVQNTWSAITYGNGLFVAIAGATATNQIMTSPDGITWTARNAPEANTWNSITYGNGRFVAVATALDIVGGDSQVMYSMDGINWSLTQVTLSNWWAVTFGGGVFVAVSNAAATHVMTSIDAVTWTVRTAPASDAWASVAYGGGLFIAVSTADTGNDAMKSSDGGVTWSLVATPGAGNSSWGAVIFGIGLFVAVSDLATQVMSADTVASVGTVTAGNFDFTQSTI